MLVTGAFEIIVLPKSPCTAFNKKLPRRSDAGLSKPRSCFIWINRSGGMLAISSDDKYAVSCSHDKSIRLWNIENKTFKSIGNHDDLVRSADNSNNSLLIASSSDDKTLRIWNL